MSEQQKEEHCVSVCVCMCASYIHRSVDFCHSLIIQGELVDLDTIADEFTHDFDLELMQLTLTDGVSLGDHWDNVHLKHDVTHTHLGIDLLQDLDENICIPVQLNNNSLNIRGNIHFIAAPLKQRSHILLLRRPFFFSFSYWTKQSPLIPTEGQYFRWYVGVLHSALGALSVTNRQPNWQIIGWTRMSSHCMFTSFKGTTLLLWTKCIKGGCKHRATFPLAIINHNTVIMMSLHLHSLIFEQNFVWNTSLTRQNCWGLTSLVL